MQTPSEHHQPAAQGLSERQYWLLRRDHARLRAQLETLDYAEAQRLLTRQIKPLDTLLTSYEQAHPQVRTCTIPWEYE